MAVQPGPDKAWLEALDEEGRPQAAKIDSAGSLDRLQAVAPLAGSAR